MKELLEDIQMDAVNESCTLGQVLRKLRVLAGKLDLEEFEEWIHKEANGYENGDALPEYRVWPVQLKGNFSGYAGSTIKNAPVPFASVPEENRSTFRFHNCFQSIASLEKSILSRRAEEQGPVSVQLPVELAHIVGGNAYQGYNCLQIWSEFGVGNVHELVNIVRNKVLDFVTELIKKQPIMEEAGGMDSEDRIQEVKNIFHTTITNSTVGNIGGEQNTAVISINKGDTESLFEKLEQIGIDSDLINDLRAVLADLPANDTNDIPEAAGSWLGRCVAKMTSGALSLSVAATIPILTNLLADYFGIDI